MRNRAQFVLLALGMTLLVVAGAAAQEGRIVYLEGDVVIRSRSAGEFFAQLGDPVAAGDVVETLDDGYAIIELNDRSSVKLRENTELVIDSLSDEAAVTLRSGSVFARVQRAAGAITGRAFEVRTPSVVAGVRGTEFFVGYGRTIEDGPDLWLCVNEGLVEVAVASTGESALVAAGEGINILSSSRITDPRFYPWTRELNWSFDFESGDVYDDTDLDQAYSDLLDQDYD